MMRYVLLFLFLAFAASAQVPGVVWDDLREQPILINPVGAVAPPEREAATGRLLFDGATDNAIALYFQMPHGMRKDYDSLYLHCHWRKTTDVAGTVDWYGTVAVMNIDTVAVAETSPVRMHEETALGSTQKHMLSEMGILNSGIGYSSIFYVTITRDASADSYNDDAELLYVDIHIPLDKGGTATPIPTE